MPPVAADGAFHDEKWLVGGVGTGGGRALLAPPVAPLRPYSPYKNLVFRSNVTALPFSGGNKSFSIVLKSWCSPFFCGQKKSSRARASRSL
jgi:hypothetical protein